MTLDQVQIDGDTYPGAILLSIKDALVSEGWTVRGSGDGSSLHGDIESADTVAPGDQGSGGQYDCWDSAADADGPQSWAWLRDPSDHRDVLLTSGDSGAADSEGRIGYARRGSGGFVGGSTSATVFPSAPSTGAGDEYWSVGSRAADGSLRPALTSASTVYSVVVAINNSFVWWVFEETSGTITDGGAWAGIFPLSGYLDTMPDRAFYGTGAMTDASPLAYFDWFGLSWVSLSVSTLNINLSTAPGGEEILQNVFAGAAGYAAGGLLRWRHGTPLGHGKRLVMPDGSVYVCAQEGGQIFILWPDDVTDLDGPTAPASGTGDTPYPKIPIPSEVVPPSASVVSPPAGSVIGKNDAITFDVTDTSGVALVLITAGYTDLAEEVVWLGDPQIPGGGEAHPFYNVTRTAITDGYRYVIKRRAGWIASPTIYVNGTDIHGNVL